jgi:3-hydroxyacyl-CoA dehydrogenase
MLETETRDCLAVLRLHCPPLNALTIPLLQELCAAIARAVDDPQINGILITGGSDHFSAGADVHLFEQIRSADDARILSRVFQQAFQAIEDSPKPVAAALAGTVVGGALELALACHLRVAAMDARFRMPEVTLGINPGAGGTQRLPRLVGLEPALRMLLKAEVIPAATALEWGLLDALASPGQLLPQTEQLLHTATAPAKTSGRTGKIPDRPACEAALQQAEASLRKNRPEWIAPARILQAVRAGIMESFERGLEIEREVFAECMQSPAARNCMYLFFATRNAGKVPELADQAAAPIRRVGVIGMGTMGTGITHAFTLAGIPVVALDENPIALQQARERIESSLHRWVQLGRLDAARASQLLGAVTTTTRIDDLGEVDLVVESVFEDLAVKRGVLAALESACPADTILATNTSTISLDELAAGSKRPERLVGMHFFNPAHRMPLVEIIRREGTSPTVLATALVLAKRLRKTPVVVANREGFLVNRIFVPYLQEAFFLLEDGADPRAVDQAAVDFGFPMGPFALIDMAGLDILVHAQRVLQRAFAHHGSLSPIAARLVQAGRLGQKTGAGIYRYEPGDVTPYDSPATASLVAQVRRAPGHAPREVPAGEIVDRLILRMVNEAFCVLQERLVQRDSDVDVAMVLGTGFPDFRGGLLRYAAARGLDQVCSRLEELSRQFGERFSPCRLLLEKKGVTG